MTGRRLRRNGVGSTGKISWRRCDLMTKHLNFCQGKAVWRSQLDLNITPDSRRHVCKVEWNCIVSRSSARIMLTGDDGHVLIQHTYCKVFQTIPTAIVSIINLNSLNLSNAEIYSPPRRW